MANKREYLKAIHKPTGDTIKVYKHREGGYVNGFDHDTKYKTEEITELGEWK